MCGFVGIFGKIDSKLKEAGGKILHRGPDMQKFCTGPDWSVQFNRLAILDLSAEGMQPFEYDSVTVFINGEIYNYLELLEENKSEFKNKTKSDVEIVPFLFRKHGIKFLNKINGMFSMVIIDQKLGKKYLIKDRYGKKPLFYSKKDNNLYFSSELKAIKSLVDVELDKINLNISLISNYIIPPLTPYKDLFSLLPGQYIEWVDNKLEKKSWYTPQIKEINLNKHQISSKFEELTNDSIELRLRSDVPVGVFLSGGLDSNFILKKAFSKNKNIIALICRIADKEKKSKNNVDNIVPKKICNELKCASRIITFDFSYLNKNLIKIINSHDELITNSGAMIFYALSEEAKKNNIKVILTGAGGDEVAGGYYWQEKLNYVPNFFYNKKFNYLNYIDKFLKFLFFKNNKFLLRIYKLYQLIFKPQNYHVETHSSNLRVFLGKNYYKAEKKIQNIYDEFYKISNLTFKKKNNRDLIDYNNVFLTISTQNYIFDMMAMAHSVENRSPLLDFKLFEFMNSIPKKIRNDNGLKSLYKNLLKKHLPEYIISSEKSGPNLPIKYWFNSRPEIKRKVYLYIKKNSDYLENYVSHELAKSINNDEVFKFDTNFEITFKVLCLIIWLKLNADKSLKDENTRLEELLNF